MLNASMMIARAVMEVYVFHSRQFHAPIMSSFFHPHEPHDDVTLDDVSPLFYPSMYPTNRKSDSDTCLTPTYSIESDLSEPSYPFVIRLTSNSSSSIAN